MCGYEIFDDNKFLVIKSGGDVFEIIQSGHDSNIMFLGEQGVCGGCDGCDIHDV